MNTDDRSEQGGGFAGEPVHPMAGRFDNLRLRKWSASSSQFAVARVGGTRVRPAGLALQRDNELPDRPSEWCGAMLPRSNESVVTRVCVPLAYGTSRLLAA